MCRIDESNCDTISYVGIQGNRRHGSGSNFAGSTISQHRGSAHRSSSRDLCGIVGRNGNIARAIRGGTYQECIACRNRNRRCDGHAIDSLRQARVICCCVIRQSQQCVAGSTSELELVIAGRQSRYTCNRNARNPGSSCIIRILDDKRCAYGEKIAPQCPIQILPQFILLIDAGCQSQCNAPERITGRLQALIAKGKVCPQIASLDAALLHGKGLAIPQVSNIHLLWIA